jgi:hypothetical protein
MNFQVRGRLIVYGKFIAKLMSAISEVYYYGIVDIEEHVNRADRRFNKTDVDLIFCQSATYSLPEEYINS